MKLEFAAFDRQPEVALDLTPFLRLCVERLLEETVGTAPLGLGAIEREVGVAQQRCGVGAVVWGEGDTDTGRRDNLLPFKLNRARDCFDQRLREPVNRVAFAGQRLDDYKLVATKARDEAVARGLAQAGGEAH